MTTPNYQWEVKETNQFEDTLELTLAPQDQAVYDAGVDKMMEATKVRNEFLTEATKTVAQQAKEQFALEDNATNIISSTFNYGPQTICTQVHREFMLDDGSKLENHVVLNINEDFSQHINDAVSSVFGDSVESDS